MRKKKGLNSLLLICIFIILCLISYVYASPTNITAFDDGYYSINKSVVMGSGQLTTDGGWDINVGSDGDFNYTKLGCLGYFPCMVINSSRDFTGPTYTPTYNTINYTVPYMIYDGGVSITVNWSTAAHTFLLRLINKSDTVHPVIFGLVSAAGLQYNNGTAWEVVGNKPVGVASITIIINGTDDSGRKRYIFYVNNSKIAQSVGNYSGGFDEIHIASYGSNNTRIDSVIIFNGTKIPTITNNYTYYPLLRSNITYNNFYTYVGINYTKNLTYNVNINCRNEYIAFLERFIDNVFESRVPITCNTTPININGNYQHDEGGAFNISFFYNQTNGPQVNNTFLSNATFTNYLLNPTISIFFNMTNQFNNISANVSLQCNSSIFTNLTYNLSFNNIVLAYQNFTNGTTLTNSSILVNGINIAKGICTDSLGGFSTGNFSANILRRNFFLIDEKTGSVFDVSNISSAKVFFDDNHSYYDFKGNGTAQVNFTSINNDKLRFEFEYLDGTIITRQIDIGVANTSIIRVCANKEGVTHYEQLIIAGTPKPVILKSIFADCLVAADYTRFAYQNAFVLKAFTIDRFYSLSSFVNDVEIILASVDGSIASFINIDTLGINAIAFDFSIVAQALSFDRVRDSDGVAQPEVRIRYRNEREDNTVLELEITRLDTDVVLYNQNNFANPNDVSILFSWATLINVTNSTLFVIEATETTEDGITSFKRYFNTIGKSGTVRSGVVFVGAFLMLIFGLTFTITRLTFSWFGLMITLVSLAVTTFAISTWFILMLQVMIVIVMVYIVIIMIQQNPATVA